MLSYALFANELFLKLPLSNNSSFNSKFDSIYFFIFFIYIRFIILLIFVNTPSFLSDSFSFSFSNFSSI